MPKEIQEEIENQIKTSYRKGDFKLCDACKKVIIGEIYRFGGEICERCYLEVKDYLK